MTAVAMLTQVRVALDHTTAITTCHVDNVEDLGLISQPSIYIDGWLYGMRMTSVVCNVPVLSQNDSAYHHSVFTT